jgi:glutamine amidotransferase-like uncharacterized protein
MKLSAQATAFSLCALSALPLSACMAPTATDARVSQVSDPALASGTAPISSGTLPVSAGATSVPTAVPASRSWVTDALVFNGTGTSASDTASVVNILTTHGLTHKTVTSAQLNALSAADLRSYGLIIWPGGVAKQQNDSLTAVTLNRVYSAVHDDGVGYVGFCAGAFEAGNYGSWGLGLTSQGFDYYQLESQGVVTAMVDATFANGSVRSLVWYGGPQLNGFGKIVAKYADGNPAIAEDEVGKGYVVLSGPHPEAPQGWRDGPGLTDRDGLDYDIALELFKAALHHVPLSSF